MLRFIQSTELPFSVPPDLDNVRKKRAFDVLRNIAVNDPAADSTSADRRIAVLEGRLRWQMRITAGLSLLVFCMLVLGAGPGGFEELTARRFVVKDSEEKPRALLTSNGGATVLSMFDSAGKARARFSVLEDGHPEISLLDHSGKMLVRIAERDGAVQLLLDDGQGNGKISLGQSGDQFGIDVTDADAAAAVRIRTSPELPQLAVMGKNGSGVVQLFAQADKSGMSVCNPGGQPGVILTMLENLRPLLLLQAQEKRTLIVPQERVDTKTGNIGSGTVR